MALALRQRPNLSTLRARSRHAMSLNVAAPRSPSLGHVSNTDLMARPGQPNKAVHGDSEHESFDTELGRPMMLPNNAMWLLDYSADRFYDVRGDSFVIHRAEFAVPGSAQKPRRSPSKALTKREDPMSLVHKVLWNHPGSIMLLEGEVVDVSDYLEDAHDLEDLPVVPQSVIQPNHTCTGIVMVPQENSTDEDSDSEQNVYYTSSTSPRRNKVMGFTCKCCGARNYSNINPQSFHKGTLVAQCAKCEKWHKISDHFGLFEDAKGPLRRSTTVILDMDNIPKSLLMLDPSMWSDEDLSAGWN